MQQLLRGSAEVLCLLCQFV
ncbi:MAG: hypothetical protein EBU33_00955 [Sphingobacteriia bacterium]|nr:hypothetical protein [Sphingobacteriia bacterium]